MSFLAIPEPITTQQQTLSACVGDTVFVPSYLPVSALADDVEVTWFRVGVPIVPADNGAVTASYSYKVDNVNLSAEGAYFASVTIPNQATVQGPAVFLSVAQKPGEFLVTVHSHACKCILGVHAQCTFLELLHISASHLLETFSCNQFTEHC